MKKIVSYCVLMCGVLLTSDLLGQLSGIVHLSGQSDHSGTVIRFTGVSPTAVSDSCVTDASGSFTVYISGGTYIVKAYHAGYATKPYFNAEATLLTSTMSLPATTLHPGNAVFVSGALAGTWSGNNVYYVTGDINVAAGGTLLIGAGAIIEFLGNYSMNISGKLEAIGTAASPVLFTSGHAGMWNQIHGVNASGSISMRHCIVERAGFGLIIKGPVSEVSNCIFRNSDVGIYVGSGSFLITGNEVYNYNLFGIWAEGTSSGTISCNTVYNSNIPNDSYGIISKSSNLVERNEIYGTKQALSVDNAGKPLMRNNYVHDNVVGLSTGSPLKSTAPHPDVRNNTFIGNSTGVRRSGYGSLTFVNNIVAGSQTAMNFSGDYECTHNLFFGNNVIFKEDYPVGAGQAVNVNGNGHSVDAYFNVLEDPLFVAGSEPLVQSSSPALNAGKGGSDIGADWASACASYVTGIREEKNVQSFAYPNPVAERLHVLCLSGSLIELFSVTGERAATLTAQTENSTLDISELGPGVYFLVITSEDHRSSTKVIKQ